MADRVWMDLTIGDTTYTVNLKENRPLLGGGERDGNILWYDESINLWRELPPVAMQRDLLHEIIHGVCMHANIDWGDNDEDYTDRLARGLNAVFVQNGIEIKWPKMPKK